MQYNINIIYFGIKIIYIVTLQYCYPELSAVAAAVAVAVAVVTFAALELLEL